MFFYRNDAYAIIAASRCGHTNMYHYHGLEPYSNTDDFSKNPKLWYQHHNPIVVLRNPLDRVRSAMLHTASNFHGKQFDYDEQIMFFYGHCYPYLRDIAEVKFRIIDFYDLDKYIPRREDLLQSYRTNCHADDTLTAEDVYVMNNYFSLQELQQEYDLYKEIITTRERVSIEEWKEITKERFSKDV
jgi:hypothetical protein